MKNSFYLIALLLICTACDNRPVSTAIVIGQEGLKDTMMPSEKVKVINFWATWCAPCVEELPYFEEIGSSYTEEVEVILITLDDRKNLQSTVQVFLQEHQIKSKVLLLDDPYAAEWIPMVDQHWDGAIPVTLIISKDKKQFFNKALTSAELENAVKKFL